jgi:hypothetical protein
MQSCDTVTVQALVDGEVEPALIPGLRLHLGVCPTCQEALEEAMLLDVLGETHGVPESPPGVLSLDGRRSRAARGPLRRRLLTTATTVALAAGLALWLSPGQRVADPAAVFASITSQPRSHAWRLAYPAADHHRPFDGSRAGTDRGQPLLVDLTAVERSGDERALAAAQLLIGMEKQAEAHLLHLAPSVDVLNDRAVARLAQGALDDAAILLERALAASPSHPQALWNKALLLERRGDAAGAARLFQRVADLGEPGWSAEARARAGGSPPR